MAIAEFSGTPVTSTRKWAYIYTSFTIFFFLTEILRLIIAKAEVHRLTGGNHKPKHFVPMEMFGFAICMLFAVASGLCWSFDAQYTGDQHKLFNSDRYHTSIPTFDYRMFMQWMVLQSIVIAPLPVLLSLWWFAMRRHCYPSLRHDRTPTSVLYGK